MINKSQQTSGQQSHAQAGNTTQQTSEATVSDLTKESKQISYAQWTFAHIGDFDDMTAPIPSWCARCGSTGQAPTKCSTSRPTFSSIQTVASPAISHSTNWIRDSAGFMCNAKPPGLGADLGEVRWSVVYLGARLRETDRRCDSIHCGIQRVGAIDQRRRDGIVEDVAVLVTERKVRGFEFLAAGGKIDAGQFEDNGERFGWGAEARFEIEGLCDASHKSLSEFPDLFVFGAVPDVVFGAVAPHGSTSFMNDPASMSTHESNASSRASAMANLSVFGPITVCPAAVNVAVKPSASMSYGVGKPKSVYVVVCGKISG